MNKKLTSRVIGSVLMMVTVGACGDTSGTQVASTTSSTQQAKPATTTTAVVPDVASQVPDDSQLLDDSEDIGWAVDYGDLTPEDLSTEEGRQRYKDLFTLGTLFPPPDEALECVLDTIEPAQLLSINPVSDSILEYVTSETWDQFFWSVACQQIPSDSHVPNHALDPVASALLRYRHAGPMC